MSPILIPQPVLSRETAVREGYGSKKNSIQCEIIFSLIGCEKILERCILFLWNPRQLSTSILRHPLCSVVNQARVTCKLSALQLSSPRDFSLLKGTHKTMQPCTMIPCVLKKQLKCKKKNDISIILLYTRDFLRQTPPCWGFSDNNFVIFSVICKLFLQVSSSFYGKSFSQV